MRVWVEGGQSLPPEWAERAVSGWKGAWPVFGKGPGRERMGVPDGQWAEGSGIQPQEIGPAGGQGRKGKRADSPRAALLSWQAQGGRSLQA